MKIKSATTDDAQIRTLIITHPKLLLAFLESYPTSNLADKSLEAVK
jgi:hypothetical protein